MNVKIEVSLSQEACFVCRQLQKQKLKHVNSIVIRDSMRNEVAKQQRTDEEMREKRDQQKMDIAKLNMMINQAEEQMVELRKRYETAVKNRTDRSDQNSGLAFTS